MNKIEFAEMVNAIANIINVKPNEIHIIQMKRKWGSCSSKRRLTFNLSLLDKNNDFIREVIIHELLHLRYEKHDLMFNSMLEVYMKKTENLYKNNHRIGINRRINEFL